MNTYGDYRDATARALAALLSQPEDPQLSAIQVQRVLGCRDLLLASLQQQFRLATGAPAPAASGWPRWSPTR